MSEEVMKSQHPLNIISLPTRYEALHKKLGGAVFRLLAKPSRQTLDLFEDAYGIVTSIEQGLFLPIYADSGTGKTTLANNLSYFLPESFTPTLNLPPVDSITAEFLLESLDAFITSELEPSDSRIIPVNIDDRESRPTTDEEASHIKRFLRSGDGARCLVIWPETNLDTSKQIAKRYSLISGSVPLDIPLEVKGPDKELWPSLAEHTLQLANDIDSLEEIVSLSSYDTNNFLSIGAYLQQIAVDFNRRRLKLLRST
ncbi:hypothetical protein, partial [Corynebacterium variabile]|uniref:hypothetical protein n=1 Tax=Corynebacterium variabile TaxID=1727 RepID=UPI003A955929